MLNYIRLHLGICFRNIGRILSVFLFWLMSLATNAAVIQYEVVPTGSASWEYHYRVNTESGEATIDYFTIFFSHSLYGNLSAVNGPVGWDILTINPDGAIPADGFYDALTFGAPIGSTPTGEFIVAFDYYGGGTPGAQMFHIVDPITFATISSGLTSAAAVAVPEPASMTLSLLALTLLVLQRKSAKRTRVHGNINWSGA